LHIGHLSNLVLAKAFQKLGVGENFISILGDTLEGSVKKEDSLVVEANLMDATSYLIKNHTISTKKDKDIYEDKKIIKDTYEFINDSIEMNFSLDLLASNVKLSKYHFLRIFKKELGITPYNFILNERVNRANTLIQKGLSISEASYEVGFVDQSHFSKNCKKFLRHTPTYLQKNSNIIL
ncbi:MAG: helix-turn-helix transcriptional regulator, partial [Campylobacteraceae bacterium]|nr:helix-turn-helix transcriptional regulator [Campylobacteraceae bacterium]